MSLFQLSVKIIWYKLYDIIQFYYEWLQKCFNVPSVNPPINTWMVGLWYDSRTGHQSRLTTVLYPGFIFSENFSRIFSMNMLTIRFQRTNLNDCKTWHIEFAIVPYGEMIKPIVGFKRMGHVTKIASIQNFSLE